MEILKHARVALETFLDSHSYDGWDEEVPHSMPVAHPVLIVEDEVLIRIDLVDTIESGGFLVSECGDGQSAIAIIDQSAELHALITDIRLGPGPNGWHVARYAREKFPDIAVLYITGDSAGLWRDEGVHNSAVLRKPFARTQMLEMMVSLLADAGCPAVDDPRTGE